MHGNNIDIIKIVVFFYNFIYFILYIYICDTKRNRVVLTDMAIVKFS